MIGDRHFDCLVRGSRMTLSTHMLEGLCLSQAAQQAQGHADEAHNEPHEPHEPDESWPIMQEAHGTLTYASLCVFSFSGRCPCCQETCSEDDNEEVPLVEPRGNMPRLCAVFTKCAAASDETL